MLNRAMIGRTQDYLLNYFFSLCHWKLVCVREARQVLSNKIYQIDS